MLQYIYVYVYSFISYKLIFGSKFTTFIFAPFHLFTLYKFGLNNFQDLQNNNIFYLLFFFFTFPFYLIKYIKCVCLKKKYQQKNEFYIEH